MNKEMLFVFLISYWAFLALGSAYFGIEITKSNLADFQPEKQTETGFLGNFMTGIFSFLEDIPFIKYFVPLAKIMTFQYKEIHPLFSIFTDALVILSALVTFLILKPNS